jgi:Na+-driven multidrug efflux pump
MRANGAVYGPLVVLTIALLPVRLGFASAFRDVIGRDAIWWSFPAGTIVSVVGAILLYRFSGWRAGSMVDRARPTIAHEQALADADACGKVAPAQ